MSSLHQEAIVIDGLIVSKWERSVFEDMRTGGITAANCTVSVWEDFKSTVDNIAEMKALIRANADLLMLVRSSADIEAAKRAGKTGIILGFQNAHAFEDHLGYVEAFADMGVRVVQLCYNTQNLIGTGCYERDGGLSGYGREVIAEMNRVGIAVDLSHVGAKTSKEAILESKKPVTYSHCLPTGLKKHPRNKTDEQLRFIADHGGFIGVTMFPPFLKRGIDSTVDDYVEAIGYVIDLVGEDCCRHRHRSHAGPRPGLLRLDHARQGPWPTTDRLRHRAQPTRHPHDWRSAEPDGGDGASRLEAITHHQGDRWQLAAFLQGRLGSLTRPHAA